MWLGLAINTVILITENRFPENTREENRGMKMNKTAVKRFLTKYQYLVMTEKESCMGNSNTVLTAQFTDKCCTFKLF